MRILNVNATLDPVSGGGTAERTFQLSKFLPREGVECAVLTLNIGLTPERRRALQQIRLAALDCILPRYYVFALPEPRIAELVRWADIVHVTGHWTLLNAVVYRTAKRLAKPWVVCPAGALPIFGRSRLIKAAYNAVVGMRIVREASAHVAIADSEIAQFECYGVSSNRVTLIPNGVDPQEFPPSDVGRFRSKFSLPKAPIILFVGRLNLIKGPDLLLEAFIQARNRLAEHHLVFAGPDDGMLSKLRRMALDAGLAERVHFIGHIGGADKAAAYRAARLLVIPSRQEAMSIVVLEAGICGTPVLITDRCGFGQIAEVGGGKVVPASNQGLRDGLLELLGDPEQLRQVGRKLEQFTRNNYLWEAAATQYLGLFRRILLHG
jgi:glycosyltransferase involved in cell wall biosynthesis